MDAFELEKKRKQYAKEIVEYNKMGISVNNSTRSHSLRKMSEILISIIKNEITNKECSIHCCVTGDVFSLAFNSSLILTIREKGIAEKLLSIFDRKDGLSIITIPIFVNGKDTKVGNYYVSDIEITVEADRKYLIGFVSELGLKVVKSNQEEMIVRLNKAIDQIKVFPKE